MIYLVSDIHGHIRLNWLVEKLEKLNELKAFSEELELKNGSIICGSVPLEISSTVIRSNLKKGIGENLADDVYEYIKARGLYSE